MQEVFQNTLLMSTYTECAEVKGSWRNSVVKSVMRYSIRNV
jgi:hypothetical protein